MADETGFVIDEVPGSDQYTWTLLDRGEVMALAPRAYDTMEEVQMATATMKLAAREAEVPSEQVKIID